MDAELTFEELKLLRLVSRTVDDLLEESLKARESLQQTFKRLFPPLLEILGAKGAVVSTLDVSAPAYVMVWDGGWVLCMHRQPAPNFSNGNIPGSKKHLISHIVQPHEGRAQSVAE